jgi:hypothetical protein
MKDEGLIKDMLDATVDFYSSTATLNRLVESGASHGSVGISLRTDIQVAADRFHVALDIYVQQRIEEALEKRGLY